MGDAAECVFGVTGERMRIPLAGPADRAGRLAGEHAATGASRPAPASWGTSIVRAFGTNAGISGLSLHAARQARLDARAVHVVAFHHASYYPGAETMVVKLVYEAGSGRVLGVQAVGGTGVDKRLDVVATLMHFGGTVHDLAQLDLAYAPPFGSAKNPLHMAALAAENDLDGLAPVVQPDADLSSYQVVDVREAHEVCASRSPTRRTPGTSRSMSSETGSASSIRSERPSSPVDRGSARMWGYGSSRSMGSGRSSTSRELPRCGSSR